MRCMRSDVDKSSIAKKSDFVAFINVDLMGNQCRSTVLVIKYVELSRKFKKVKIIMTKFESYI